MRIKHLLVAESDADLRALVVETLRSPFYQILEAPDGSVALELARLQRPDLVILGRSTPTMNALEVCQRITRDPALEDTAVIMFRGPEVEPAGKRALGAGAAALLSKPFSPLELLDLVNDVVQPRRGKDAVARRWGGFQDGMTARAQAAFMFADIRGFTTFTLKHGNEAAYRLIDRFQQLVRQHCGSHESWEANTAGDNILLVFPTARQAVLAATGIMEGVSQHNVDHPDAPLEIGIGLDAGEAIVASGDCFGVTVNRAARLTAEARGGQVLASEAIHNLVAVPGITWRDLGPRPLRGFDTDQHVYELEWRYPASECFFELGPSVPSRSSCVNQG